VTAHLFAEAVDTLLTLCRALTVWIVLLSVVATCAVYTVVTAVAWMWRGVWRCGAAVAGLRKRQAGACGPRPVSQDSRDAGTPPGASQAPSRPVPCWAQPDEEAA
jgi:hypothetical protein